MFNVNQIKSDVEGKNLKYLQPKNKADDETKNSRPDPSRDKCRHL
jgi:hypothetical protein